MKTRIIPVLLATSIGSSLLFPAETAGNTISGTISFEKTGNLLISLVNETQ